RPRAPVPSAPRTPAGVPSRGTGRRRRAAGSPSPRARSPAARERAPAAGWSPSRSPAWRPARRRSTPRRVRPGVRARESLMPDRRTSRSPTRWTLAEVRRGYEPKRHRMTLGLRPSDGDLAWRREACEIAVAERSGYPLAAAYGLLENLEMRQLAAVLLLLALP